MDDTIKCNEFFKQILDKDPNFLKNLFGISEETRNILLECIREYQEKHDIDNAGYIESELIRRFLQPSPFLKEKVDIVEGPVSVYQMSSDEYPQIFYMFGDNHVKRSKCGNITRFHTWLKDTTVTSPVFIDVYLETPYIYKDYSSVNPSLATSYIQEFYVYFKDCFLHSKDPKYCQTSRFHYIDTRRISETPQQRRGSLYMYRNIYNLKTGEGDKEKVSDTNDYIDFVLNPNTFLRKRVKKQFDAIKDDRIRNIFETDFAACKVKFEKRIKYLKQNDRDYLEVDRILWDVRFYAQCLMDYYVIARCFRSFDKRRGYSRPSYNNIIYVGDSHIAEYFKILGKLGFHIVEKVPAKAKDNIKFQCLNISEIQQPLFYQRYIPPLRDLGGRAPPRSILEIAS
uniref:Uncharacterized protein n=1 Tax=Marseillevirus LCMAC101 TaxID=2506602 RepID=A0A481YRT2_9VIRU|nr:MAG: hypothetical protein LCMAC101_00120 [Marseillevirus LCMAC101]